MKFEIYDETKKPEPVCRFRLIEDAVNEEDVTLVAVDENGEVLEYGNILTLCSNTGKFHRHGYCSVPGIRIDSFGKIVEGR